MTSQRPSVVVIGRPNVGKSALVNRLVGRRVAVVEEISGVTRDRKVLEGEWRGVSFDVVDTGGWMPSGDDLEEKISAQAQRALESADLLLLVVDAQVSVTEGDLAAARWALQSKRLVLLVVNKVDDASLEANTWEFLQLGAGEPVAVSALHGRGAGDLLDAIVDRLGGSTAGASESTDDGTLSVAIVGRPNVGKSTLFNRLIGEDRAVVHDLPGTTRDAIDTVIDTEHGRLRFIDTAGMRRRARTEPGLETYSVIRSLAALDRADIALLVIDGTVGATAQDQRLAERISAAGCPAIVVLNKWELLDAEARESARASVGDRLAFLGDAPVLSVSALTGKGAHRIMPALSVAADEYSQRIATGPLNRAVRDLQTRHPSPTGRIRYAVQGAIAPPTFTLFCSGRLAAPYLRYVERSLREHFDLGSTPVKIRVRVD